jgi:hypothetical protein
MITIAAMVATIPAAVSATIAAAVTPAAGRRAAITGAVVPISRAGAAVISAAPANDHTGLNDRRAIPITGLVARRVSGVRGIAARRVGGRAVRINGATGHESGRSDDQTCSYKFHGGERRID